MKIVASIGLIGLVGILCWQGWKIQRLSSDLGWVEYQVSELEKAAKEKEYETGQMKGLVYKLHERVFGR